MRVILVLLFLMPLLSSNAQIKTDERIYATRYNCIEFILSDGYPWSTYIKICTKEDNITVNTGSYKKFAKSISSRYVRYADDLPAIIGLYEYLFGNDRQIVESAEHFFYMNYTRVENIQKIKSGNIELKDGGKITYHYWSCEGFFCETAPKDYLPIESVDYYHTDGDRSKIKSTVIPIYVAAFFPMDTITINNR